LVFQVKQLSPPPPHSQPVLPIRPGRQREGIPAFFPHQGHGKASSCQGSTDPDHPLIIVQIVGHGAKDPLSHPANLVKTRHITQLPVDNRHFCRIFALDNNNFGKIILILPPAITGRSPGMIAGIFGCQ
jgi:hypothetical protein